MKKYYNTRQVLRDVENGTLTPEEGEKILAEMAQTVAGIEDKMRGVEEKLDSMGKGLEQKMVGFEKKLDKLTRDLDTKFH